MPDLFVPAANSIMAMFLRTIRAGAPVRAVSGVAPGSIFHCLTKWCTPAVSSSALEADEDLDEDDEEDREGLDDDDDDDDFDDDDFLDDDDNDDEDLEDDEDDDDLSDEDELDIDNDPVQ